MRECVIGQTHLKIESWRLEGTKLRESVFENSRIGQTQFCGAIKSSASVRRRKFVKLLGVGAREEDTWTCGGVDL